MGGAPPHHFEGWCTIAFTRKHDVNYGVYAFGVNIIVKTQHISIMQLGVSLQNREKREAKGILLFEFSIQVREVCYI